MKTADTHTLDQPIKFSICMTNLNMENFLEPSILSIYNQLSTEFEIIVIDGGSTDASLQVLTRLADRLDRLRVFSLPRDKNRKLGADRNYSIEKARGEYVLLHLDCDDLYLPYVQDWVNVFLYLELLYGPEILVAGQQINMGRKAFLQKHGPYKNLHFEDRELWNRLDLIGCLIRLQHKPIMIRMKIPQPAKTFKIFKRSFARILEDLQQPETRPLSYLFRQLRKTFDSDVKIGLFHFLMTIIVLPHHFWIGKERQTALPFDSQPAMESKQTTLESLILDRGGDPELLDLTSEGRRVFFEEQ